MDQPPGAAVRFLHVIANQSADWCGNLLFTTGIPTPACELARNDIFIV